MKIFLVLVRLVFRFIFFGHKGHIDTSLKNLALRQQINVLQRSIKPPNIKNRDRLFWVVISKVYMQWRSALSIVQPDTIVDGKAKKKKKGQTLK